MIAALPDNEEARLAAVAAYKILDTDTDFVYSDFIKIASYVADVPIALITLIDRDKQIFKSKIGLDSSGTPREQSFCAHAILTPNETFVVEDATKDTRFADNPFVIGDPNVRFYCGVPLVTQDQFALGTLCVIDNKPRALSQDQVEVLRALARRVVNRFEIDKTFKDLEVLVSNQQATESFGEIENLTHKLGNLLLKKKSSDKRNFNKV